MPFESAKQYWYLKKNKPEVFKRFISHERSTESAVRRRLMRKKMASLK